MAEPQERYYDTKKLNVIFAVVSLILLTAVGMMFLGDYSREWKTYQQQFRALEIEKTRVKYDTELNKLKKDPQHQELEEKLLAAKKDHADRCSKLGDVESAIKKLTAESELIDQDYKFKKAELDAAKFVYEEAKHKNSLDLPASQKEYESLSKKVAELKLQLEVTNQSLADKTSIISECGKQLKDLEQQSRTLSQQKKILERKLKKIDPGEMSMTNQIADLVRDLPVIDLSNPKYKVEQIVLKDIEDEFPFSRVPKVDRCITCHKGIDNPDYKDAPQPFRTHPNLEMYIGKNSPHPMEEYGCTTCHQGRGRGTDFVSAAHTPRSPAQAKEWEEKYKYEALHHWETPMFPVPYTEAGCFKCHASKTNIKDADKLNLGLNLIEKSGCYSCHTIQKYKDWPKPGPDLTHIASKMSEDWAYRWIKDPHAFRPNTWMPAFYGQSNNSDPESKARGDQEIHAMVRYLYTHSEEFKQAEMPNWGDAVKGEEVIKAVGCMACHNTLKDKRTGPTTQASLNARHGPSLTGLGGKTSKKWLYNWLKDPHRYHPETRMPNLRLTDQEAADAAAYLAGDKNEAFNKTVVPPVDEKLLAVMVREQLVKFMTQAQADAELAKMSTEDRMLFAGKKLIGQYGCYSCHTIKGFENVKPIGTELTEEGNKPIHNLDFAFIHLPHTKEAWFKQKLLDPRIFDEGKLKAHDEKLRMPNYEFSEQEAEAIVTALLGFVKERPTKVSPRTTENISIEKGQVVVRQFNCQGCHLIEGEGASIQTTVAEWLVKYDNRTESEAQALINSFSPPNLVGEGEKVQSKWLFDFLHDPATIRPWLKVRMPTYNFKAEPMNDLVKYFNALDGQDSPFTEFHKPVMDAEELTAGEKLFSKDYFGCAQCHIVGDQLPSGSPDSWAPDFAIARDRLKPDWIIRWLKNPQELMPGTKMPTYFDPSSFSEAGPPDILEGDENAQIKTLRDYVFTLSEHPPRKAETVPAAPAPEQPETAPATTGPAGSPTAAPPETTETAPQP